MAKAELTEINLLETLTAGHDFYSSIFLTYGADLAFFERAILSGYKVSLSKEEPESRKPGNNWFSQQPNDEAM